MLWYVRVSICREWRVGELLAQLEPVLEPGRAEHRERRLNAAVIDFGE